ncbi:hypothetical protein SERLA73DRAFT_87161 [Serpula lacrymans var. lacrymans S7.3]|uniref:Impact N-terminal domain-containing protein n=2 Tax=Serpula lacrymans var. lacrymans TaxID=341189 RepID=F8PSY6_SERL3|nr:uncharacterized protein SERLADRAFT_447663 [Serpula lacrymans var. lacrymans S7.9]EGO00844.1 hypothetical protein SERLA73DRAFT_87161 [Serpula lacrymans var. lacrymans S7.3]EGO26467.1 hypothetical protein SERLADRAFT_447663 [Serpula lacrymans var. lacrymans S7.9]
MSNLDSFVQSSRPPPKAVATSQELRDRGSIFVGNVYRATSPEEARAAVRHQKLVMHADKPAYEISAWRCMVLKHGKTGLEGPDDFELKVGSDDDGEQWGGNKVLKTMHSEGLIDAVVIVSRWYGGTMLGPARFTHIETCVREVSRTFKRLEEMEECISTLTTLDDLLADLRSELNSISSTSTDTIPFSSPQESSLDTLKSARIAEIKKAIKPDYSAMQKDVDLAKARRLITARENAIKSVKTLLTRKNSAEHIST